MVAGGRLLAAPGRARRALRPRRAHLLAAAVVVLVVAVALQLRGSGAPAPAGAAGLRVTVLDVGQGDAILLDPAPGDPILVDAGPVGAGLAARLRDGGVERLAAAVISHDQSDHAGGLPELIDAIPVSTLAYGRRSRRLSALARAGGVAATRVAEGSELRSGALRLEVLWPPRTLLDGASSSDPNALSVVLLARWHRFEMLLTGDAEAEAVPVEPGPLDVLKVAHHGSADPGLGGLLDLSAPRVAVISVGADNPFGHPTPETLEALAGHDVEALRTDLAGDVAIDVSRGGWSVHGVE
ncbi:MAG: MBL fold metallo-hydrolase [bacterium]